MYLSSKSFVSRHEESWRAKVFRHTNRNITRRDDFAGVEQILSSRERSRTRWQHPALANDVIQQGGEDEGDGGDDRVRWRRRWSRIGSSKQEEEGVEARADRNRRRAVSSRGQFLLVRRIVDSAFPRSLWIYRNCFPWFRTNGTPVVDPRRRPDACRAHDSDLL